MLDNPLLNKVDNLSEPELRELYSHILSKLDIVPPGVTYQQKHTGRGNQLYWYAYFRWGDKVHCVYAGKEKREIDPVEVLKEKGIIKSKKGGK